jgi:hypothetical protein
LSVHFLTDGDDSWKSNFDDDKKPFRLCIYILYRNEGSDGLTRLLKKKKKDLKPMLVFPRVFVDYRYAIFHSVTFPDETLFAKFRVSFFRQNDISRFRLSCYVRGWYCEVPSIKLGHVIHLLSVHFLTDGDDSWKSNFDDDKKPFRLFIYILYRNEGSDGLTRLLTATENIRMILADLDYPVMFEGDTVHVP